MEQTNRRNNIIIIFSLVFLIIWIRLFYLQVYDNEYKEAAINNSRRRVTIYPDRGLILDRNNEILASNKIGHDLMVVPRYVKDIDTLLLCDFLGITIEDFNEQLRKCKQYSNKRASIFYKLLDEEQYSKIQEQLFKFKGFYFQERTIRRYNKDISAHIIGSIGEIDLDELQENPYYSGGDFIGKTGLEKYYENELRGTKGVRYAIVDVNNVEQGSYYNGKYDTVAICGKNIKISIDWKLQEYAEKIMSNKIGSIVAIDPNTGEILTLVSSPSYESKLLIGQKRNENYKKLLKDTLKPLHNRAISAEYPPGSIFKLAQAIVALDEGVINENSYFPCDKYLVGCHNHPLSLGVSRAIQYSCNPYFYHTYKKIIQQRKEKNIFKDASLGLEQWNNNILRLKFGLKTGIDLPNEKAGFIPDTNYYDKLYGHRRWAFSTIYSNAIGQGEVLATPLQLANFSAIIVNRGFYYTPHFVIAINDTAVTTYKKIITPYKKSIFNTIVKGMYYVVNDEYGTGYEARIDNIAVCGKTGTAQNSKKDHSVFIAFAPMDNPKIAICVYVENAGFGGVWAAPIARLIIEKHLNDTISNKESEEKIINSTYFGKTE